MTGIYKLDDLGGLTVGQGQDCNNFAEVIDHLLEKYPYKQVKKMLGFDSIADLSEYLTDCYGDYDEAEAKEICIDAFDGEDIDDADPDVEWGDEMYCRQAGK